MYSPLHSVSAAVLHERPRLDRERKLDIIRGVTLSRRYVDGGPTTRLNGDDTEPESVKCDACGESIEGSPAGTGLFLWTRGDEVRYEEPPLCERCACAIAVGGMLAWESEEEG